MSIDIEHDGDVVWVRLAGTLDATAATALLKQIRPLLKRSDSVTLDLHRVDKIDSAGVAAMAESLMLAGRFGARLNAINARPIVAEMLGRAPPAPPCRSGQASRSAARADGGRRAHLHGRPARFRTAAGGHPLLGLPRPAAGPLSPAGIDEPASAADRRRCAADRVADRLSPRPDHGLPGSAPAAPVRRQHLRRQPRRRRDGPRARTADDRDRRRWPQRIRHRSRGSARWSSARR